MQILGCSAGAKRIAEVTVAMVAGLMLLGGPEGGSVGAAAGERDRDRDRDRMAVDSFLIAQPGVGPRTAQDSLEAERGLPASAVRRPLERYLGRYSDDRLLVRQISRAVIREAGRQRVPPSLITAVLLTENTTLRPEAASVVGAQGLMQVMPFHAGARLCNSDDLVNVDSNICHGTLILARNLRATRTSADALLRYNGCVRGTTTPNCHRYPAIVLARASRVRAEILAAAAPVELAQR
jgi:soluble lytic murein transglycosylase-like protein